MVNIPSILLQVNTKKYRKRIDSLLNLLKKLNTYEKSLLLLITELVKYNNKVNKKL